MLFPFGEKMAEKMSLLFVSGTVDKLMAGSIITSGAVANEMDVDIFVSFWGMLQFRKNNGSAPKLSYDGAEMSEEIFKIMQEKKVPSWLDMLRQAKEIGNVKVYACAMFADLLGLKKEDLDPIVDEIIGVSEFVAMSKDSNTTLFI